MIKSRIITSLVLVLLPLLVVIIQPVQAGVQILCMTLTQTGGPDECLITLQPRQSITVTTCSNILPGAIASGTATTQLKLYDRDGTTLLRYEASTSSFCTNTEGRYIKPYYIEPGLGGQYKVWGSCTATLCAETVYVEVNDDPCAMHSSQQSCIHDCRCGWCGDSQLCLDAATTPSCPAANGSPPIDKQRYNYQTESCDNCVQYSHVSDPTLCTSAIGGASCGWCSGTQTCTAMDSTKGPYASPVPSGCGPAQQMRPSAADDCSAFRDESSCTHHCGCGWCADATNAPAGAPPGSCMAVYARGGGPKDMSRCPTYGSPNTRFEYDRTCLAMVQKYDSCADIPHNRCLSVCYCGLCKPTHSDAIDTDAICMSGNDGGGGSGNTANNGPMPNGYNRCPRVGTQDTNRLQYTFQWNTPNPGSCSMFTSLTDPCSAFPVNSGGALQGICQTQCGCGVCHTSSGSSYCRSGTTGGARIDQFGVDPCPAGWDPPILGPQGSCNDPADTNFCWRRPKKGCGMNTGSIQLRMGSDKQNFKGCGWCHDSGNTGCVPIAVVDTVPPSTASNGPYTGNSVMPTVGRQCSGLDPLTDASRVSCYTLHDELSCANTCGCGWCKSVNGDGFGECHEADPQTARPYRIQDCPAPKAFLAHSSLNCQFGFVNSDNDVNSANGGNNNRVPERITDGDRSNLSLVAGCGAILIVALVWFHMQHRTAESMTEPGQTSLRAPFPDRTEEELEERTCRKFLRLVQLYHPITMLVYAANRDGFGRARRLFCIFVALSCQLTVTLAVMLLSIPGYGASLLSASVSFVYEKPIVKLVKFTARQECCGSCCNCFSASLSYCFVISCFMQIPAVLIAFYFWGYRAGNFHITFGMTQLMSAWAASVALGYVTSIASIAARFCCCPAKYTKEMNDYSREFEKFNKEQNKQIQMTQRQPTLVAAKGGSMIVTANSTASVAPITVVGSTATVAPAPTIATGMPMFTGGGGETTNNPADRYLIQQNQPVPNTFSLQQTPPLTGGTISGAHPMHDRHSSSGSNHPLMGMGSGYGGPNNNNNAGMFMSDPMMGGATTSVAMSMMGGAGGAPPIGFDAIGGANGTVGATPDVGGGNASAGDSAPGVVIRVGSNRGREAFA